MQQERRTGCEPMTTSFFDRWREKEFVPHIAKEEDNTKQILELKTTISSWIKAYSIFSTIVIALGGASLYLFGWIVNDQINEKREDRKAIMQIANTQSGIVATLTAHREADQKEFKKITQTETALTKEMLAHIEVQNKMMVELVKKLR